MCITISLPEHRWYLHFQQSCPGCRSRTCMQAIFSLVPPLGLGEGHLELQSMRDSERKKRSMSVNFHVAIFQPVGTYLGRPQKSTQIIGVAKSEFLSVLRAPFLPPSFLPPPPIFPLQTLFTLPPLLPSSPPPLSTFFYSRKSPI